MTLRIGTPVRWPNPPIGWRRGTIVAVIPPGQCPDCSPFDGPGYRLRSDTSYLVREAGPGGRLLWPSADHLLATGEAPAVLPITTDELQWCTAHPDLVRAAMARGSRA